MTIEIKVLGASDRAVLDRVADGVFDLAISDRLTNEFLIDPRHHLVVAIDDGCVVGMVSAVHYVHPDKPNELWINEAGVAATHRGLGIGKTMIHAMTNLGRQLGCTEAWVLTKQDNMAAMRLYESAGGISEPNLVTFTFQLNGKDAEIGD